jgi:hypothetical protein
LEAALTANVLLILAVMGCTLTALEIFLSDQQKQALSLYTLKVWNALDELKKLSFMEPLKRRSIQISCFAVGGLLVVGLFIGEFLDDNADDYVTFPALAAVGIALIYVFALFPWMLRARSPGVLLANIVILLLLPILAKNI